MRTKKDNSSWNFNDLDDMIQGVEKHRTKKELDILQAAEKLFAEKGHARTTTSEIARLAKTTERTLFKYYSSKDELVRQVLTPIILKTIMPSQVERTVKLINMEWKSPQVFLKSLYLNRLETGIQIGDKIKFLLGEILQDNNLQEVVTDYWRKNVYPEFRKVIVEFQNEEKIRNDIDPDIISRTLITALFGQVVLFSVFRKDASKVATEQIDEVIDLLVNGTSL